MKKRRGPGFYLILMLLQPLVLTAGHGARVYDDATPPGSAHQIGADPQGVEVKNFIHTTNLQTLLLNLYE